MTNPFYEQVALWSQVAGAVIFAAFLIWAFNKYLTPAVAAATRAKNEEIAAAVRRRDDARKELERAQGEVREAEGAVAQIRSRAEAEAQREHDRIVAEAKADGERQIANANGELERARLAARDRFRVELIEKALRFAREDAARSIDERANRDLVGKFVDRIERGDVR